jgi:hypothetical protein
MVFGVALIVVVIVYQQPKVPAALRRIAADRRRRARTLRDDAEDERSDAPALRDVIGWIAFLLGLAAIAYGVYLQRLAG